MPFSWCCVPSSCPFFSLTRPVPSLLYALLYAWKIIGSTRLACFQCIEIVTCDLLFLRARSKLPCTECGKGRSTLSEPGEKQSVINCFVQPGFGIYNPEGLTPRDKWYDTGASKPVPGSLEDQAKLDVAECPIGAPYMCAGHKDLAAVIMQQHASQCSCVERRCRMQSHQRLDTYSLVVVFMQSSLSCASTAAAACAC